MLPSNKHLCQLPPWRMELTVFPDKSCTRPAVNISPGWSLQHGLLHPGDLSARPAHIHTSKGLTTISPMFCHNWRHFQKPINHEKTGTGQNLTVQSSLDMRMGNKHTCILLLQRPEIIVPLYFIGASLDYIAELVPHAVYLLAVELHHYHRVALYKLDIHELHITSVQDCSIWHHALHTRQAV